jgi:hypothetical protein
MRTRLLCLILALAALLVAVPAASAASASTPKRPSPAWLTPTLKAQIQASGAKGKKVAAEYLNTDCPGVQAPAGVSAAGCIVAPYGCTANFIFKDATNWYVGTASHCTDTVGQTVTMQVDTTTLADVGTVAKRTPKQEPGEDFALIKLDPAVVAKWGVNPAVPVLGGPNGIYTGCGPEVVRHYGHGYGVAVSQGKTEGGLATNWHDAGYGWTGAGAPGDSGSPVLTSGGLAAGDFTHLIVDFGSYPGSDLAGMRITSILDFAGVSLVNADGTTTSWSGTTNCG